MQRSLKVLLALATAAVLTACGEGGGDEPAAPSAPAPVSLKLGVAGGTLEGPDGVRLQVPPGALRADATLTVARADASAPPLPTLPAGFAVSGPMMALTPHGTSFGTPVMISIPRGDLPADALPMLIKTNAAGDGWEQIPAQVEGDRVVAWITRFSNISHIYCGSRCAEPGPPVITGQPQSGSVNEHGAIIMGVDAVGLAPFTYQWDGGAAVDLRAERNRGVVITPVTMAMNGMELRVTVTDARGRQAASQPARVTVLPAAPQQASAPADVQVVEGSDGVFSAGTTSSIAQTLQWERKDPSSTTWAAVPYPANPTAQNPTLRVPAVGMNDDQAQYRLRATNAAGTVATTAAWLRVLPAPTLPVITQEPADTVAAGGLGAQFSVVATGTDLKYQWQRSDGGGPFTAITQGGDLATYTLPNTLATDDGARFRVQVSNSVGTVQSAAATLGVTVQVGLQTLRLSGGARHSMALDASGRLWAWGANESGQAGRVAETAPVLAPGTVTMGAQDLYGVATFSTGANHTLALLDDGTVLRWGSNERGQLALEMSTAYSAEPLRLPDSTAAGRDVVAGVQASGVLQNFAGAPTRVWGMGAVGDGRSHGSLSWSPTTGAPSGPVDITGMTLVRGAFGLAHSLAVRDDGSVYAWGFNQFGQLGLGDNVARLEPTRLPGLADVMKVQVGNTHSAALTRDGRVFTWGRNDVHQLGGHAPQNTAVNTPRAVAIAAVVIDLACGDDHCLALSFDGRVFAWGSNRFGQVGDGSTADVATPVEVTGRHWSVRAGGIGAGRHHSLAYDMLGNVWAWGHNGTGQLGLDTAQFSQSNRPVRVPQVPRLLPGGV